MFQLIGHRTCSHSCQSSSFNINMFSSEEHIFHNTWNCSGEKIFWFNQVESMPHNPENTVFTEIKSIRQAKIPACWCARCWKSEFMYRIEWEKSPKSNFSGSLYCCFVFIPVISCCIRGYVGSTKFNVCEWFLLILLKKTHLLRIISLKNCKKTKNCVFRIYG